MGANISPLETRVPGSSPEVVLVLLPFSASFMFFIDHFYENI